VKDSAEPFDCQELELAQIRSCHQSGGFGTKELFERQSQQSRNWYRSSRNLPHRDLFQSSSPFSLNCQIQPAQSLRNSEDKILRRLWLEIGCQTRSPATTVRLIVA
jgi:hypothetical protein